MDENKDVAVPEEEMAPKEASQDAEVTPDGQDAQAEEPAAPKAEEDSPEEAASESEEPVESNESSDEQKASESPEEGERNSGKEAGVEFSEKEDSEMTPEQKEMLDSIDDTPKAESGGSNLLSQDELDAVIKDAVESEGAGTGGFLDSAEIPQSSDSSIADVLTQESKTPVGKAEFQQLSPTMDSVSARNIDLLMDVDLPVSIELGRTHLNIADILALGPGSVVELEKLVGEPVDLLVNQKCVARGEVVVVEENFGLRITELVSAEERIKNLQ